MKYRVPALLVIFLLSVISRHAGDADACCDWTGRDESYWVKMHNAPRLFLYNPEPVSLRPAAGKAHVLNEKGIKAFSAGDYASARSYFTEALDMNPESSLLNHNLALVFYYKPDMEKAVYLWQKAAAIEPENLRYRYHLASALSFDGKTREAIRQYRLIIMQLRDEPELYNNIGQLYEFKGDLRQAEVNYRHAVKLKPDYTKALYNLSRVLTKGGRLREVEGVHKRILRISPDDVEGYIGLGNIYRDTGRRAMAVQYYKKAITLRADYPEIHILLSGVYREMGRIKEAQDEEKLANTVMCTLRPDME